MKMGMGTLQGWALIMLFCFLGWDRKPMECSRDSRSVGGVCGGVVTTLPLPQLGFPWRSQTEYISSAFVLGLVTDW